MKKQLNILFIDSAVDVLWYEIITKRLSEIPDVGFNILYGEVAETTKHISDAHLVLCDASFFIKQPQTMKLLMESAPDCWFAVFSVTDDSNYEEIDKALELGVKHTIYKTRSFRPVLLELVKEYLDSENVSEGTGFTN